MLLMRIASPTGSAMSRIGRGLAGGEKGRKVNRMQENKTPAKVQAQPAKKKRWWSKDDTELTILAYYIVFAPGKKSIAKCLYSMEKNPIPFFSHLTEKGPCAACPRPL